MSDKIHTDAEDILQELQNKNKQKVNNSCGCSHEEPESVAQTQSEGSCGCSHEEPSHGHEHSSASLIKPASDFKKPDGLTVVRPENVSTFLEPLKIRDVPGIGKKTEVKLESMGFATIGQLVMLTCLHCKENLDEKSGHISTMHQKVRMYHQLLKKNQVFNIAKYPPFPRILLMKIIFYQIYRRMCEQIHEIVMKKAR